MRICGMKLMDFYLKRQGEQPLSHAVRFKGI